MSKGNVEDKIAQTIFDLMYYLNQSFSDIMNLPVPLAGKLMKILEKTKKEEAKAFKK